MEMVEEVMAERPGAPATPVHKKRALPIDRPETRRRERIHGMFTNAATAADVAARAISAFAATVRLLADEYADSLSD